MSFCFVLGGGGVPHAVVQHWRRQDALVEPVPADKLDAQQSESGELGAVGPCVLGTWGKDG